MFYQRCVFGTPKRFYGEPFLGFNNMNPLGFFVSMKKVLYGTIWVHSLSFVLSFPDEIFHIIKQTSRP